LTCVAEIKEELISRNLPTVHLISVGGWNAPHPDTTNTPEAVYENWLTWNNGLFDGFDWDVEGNDDFSSPYNRFTPECLDLMGRMSQLAKTDGYIVSMAPAESYMDPTTPHFDHLLTHNYPEWETLQPEFHYHGHNTYSYLLAAYGFTSLASGKSTTSVPTFDFISIQLYESWTHAVYNVTILNTPPEEYLRAYVTTVLQGWDVAVTKDGSLSRMSIPQTQLVIGLGNGWVDGNKSLLVWPEQAEAAYEALKAKDSAPRGFMFWDIADEGRVVSGTDREMWMAAGLNKFLHTRDIVPGVRMRQLNQKRTCD
jgi:chitinase